MKIRIGIDVGGTFTDAAAINNDTYELVGVAKTPTTHTAKEGVAAGIVKVLHEVLEKCNIDPKDVNFIAHGTTQATNALLEGDVAKVGIITLGQGLEGMKSKSDTSMGKIELASSKFLSTENEYVDTSQGNIDQAIEKALNSLKDKGCTSIVAAEAFSVDDPQNEDKAVEACISKNISATATNDISKLYGLKIRTRTAVINASIMPKMMEAANMTEDSVKKAGIENPLMVMRCDGGVMTVDEVRHRPILTILSGPAAGVAGALMYEKLTDGIFFEVGGTSTDMSCVKDGKVMIKYAEVGGHKTYLSSMDVRTIGIGGGSMVEIRNGSAVDSGPRSAHIAGLEYEVYTDVDKIVNPKLVSVRPKEGDPEYASIQCDNGISVALTVAGAANIAGYVMEGDYAFGNLEAARKAWQPLADNMGCTVEEAAKNVLDFSAEKNMKVVKQLIKDYDMDPRTTIFVGGGGGASTVVPHLAEKMNHKYKIAENGSVISTIGVSLAMVRDMVERSITNPTEDDIISVRREAELKAVQNGAAPGTIEVSVEVDTQRNLVRAIAVGATEMRSKNLLEKDLSEDELLEIVAKNLEAPKNKLVIAGDNGFMRAIKYEKTESKMLGLIKKKTTQLRLIDNQGVIRLQKNNAVVVEATVENWKDKANWLIEELAEYNDGGENLPNIYLVLEKRIIDLSGLPSSEQIISIGSVELNSCGKDEKLIMAATKRTDS